jgi:hypothetical protein
MTAPKTFQFKIEQPARNIGALNRPQEQGNLVETFAGEIQGKDASDLEERWARTADKRGDGYDFRTANVVGRNLPGEVELDFLMYVNPEQPQPIQIDGEIGHNTKAEQDEDAVKDAILNEELKGYAAPVIRVKWDKLQSQEDTDRTYAEIFGR